MVERELLSHVSRLADLEGRTDAAVRLAHHLGVDEIVIFVPDPELDVLLPAPGFPRTLPDGRRWQEFLAQCTPGAPTTGTLTGLARGEPTPAIGLAAEDGAVLVMLGTPPSSEKLEALRLLLPLLSTTFAREHLAKVAAADESIAEQAAANARHMARTLETMRRQLSHALGEATVARRNLAFLAGISETLTTSLNLEQTLVSIAAAPVPYLSECCLVMVEPRGSAPHVEVGSHDPAQRHALHALALDIAKVANQATPIGHALSTRSPEIYRIASIDELTGDSQRTHPPLGSLLPASLMVVPLPSDERATGVIIFISPVALRTYDAKHLTLAKALARRAALAIDNALLYLGAQEAIQIRDTFLSIAAHELRTPISSLRGHVQLLLRNIHREHPVPRERLGRALVTIERQSDKLVQLINQLLDVSRIENGKLELELAPTDVSVLVQSVAQLIAPTLDLHAIRLNLDPGIVADIDALRVEQVITNLINNAVKYSPTGDEIGIDVRRPDPDHVAISVSDHGLGIPPALRQRIFERFFQAHDPQNFGGMGLGLYISHEIVSLHGGEIIVAPVEDGGTCFTVKLPTHSAKCSMRHSPAALVLERDRTHSA